MFRVAVERDFVARHFLVGGDWGAENEEHSHHYRIELVLAGNELDEHFYLVDIVDINSKMDKQVSYYRDKTLNDLSVFANVNPSIEYFSKVLCEALNASISAPNISKITVKLWENQIAWASYEQDR